MGQTAIKPNDISSITVFTDRELSKLYAELKRKFIDTSLEINPQFVESIAREIDKKFAPGGPYVKLSDEDRCKVYTVYATSLQAKAWKTMPDIDTQLLARLFKGKLDLYPQDTFYNCHYSDYSHAAWYDGFFWGAWLSSSNSSHRWTKPEAILFMVAVFLTIFAFFYLLVAIVESLERFYHNEGWLQATISLVSIAAGALAGAAAVFFMLNPATIVIVASGIVAAAISVGLTNIIQKKCITLANKDALDEKDPHRFKLTERDIANFKRNGCDLDPIKVKLAIAALTAEIEELPSVYARMFKDSGTVKQKLMDKVRNLRKGICDPDGTVSVNSLRFNLRPNPQPSLNVQPLNANESVLGTPVSNRSGVKDSDNDTPSLRKNVAAA